MRKLLLVGLSVGLLVVCSGCLSLSRSEREDLRVIREAGFSRTEAGVKSPLLAALLNLLPGIGNFYLSAGTDEGEMVFVGVMNLLTWPVSILWGVPEAAIDANNINKRETVYHFMRTERGREQIRDALEGRKKWEKRE